MLQCGSIQNVILEYYFLNSIHCILHTILHTHLFHNLHLKLNFHSIFCKNELKLQIFSEIETRNEKTVIINGSFVTLEIEGQVEHITLRVCAVCFLGYCAVCIVANVARHLYFMYTVYYAYFTYLKFPTGIALVYNWYSTIPNISSRWQQCTCQADTSMQFRIKLEHDPQSMHSVLFAFASMSSSFPKHMFTDTCTNTYTHSHTPRVKSSSSSLST